MKRVICILWVAMALKGLAFAQCQFALEPQGSIRCSVLDGDYRLLPDSTSACRNSAVAYTVRGDSVNSYHYSWQVTGGIVQSFSADSTTAQILWGDATEGHIVLTRANGRRQCTITLHVTLVDKPTAICQATPNLTMTSEGLPVINVCSKDKVILSDHSVSIGTPITDYYWECDDILSTEPAFVFTPNEEGSYTVTHRVYNACGCYDEEEITINAAEECPLEISCYGTVCSGSEQSYSVTAPVCEEYMWSAENGTIIKGQGSSDIIVKWGDPESGYGILTLDGSSCECECKGRKSIRVPIISQNAVISGPDTVCIGSQHLYRLPLYGSTSYAWTVQPAGTNIANSFLPNEKYITFNQAGTFTIAADYICPLLNCAGSSEKAVVVLDSLRITPRSAKICQGYTLSVSTDSQEPVRWSVMKGDTLLFDTTGVFLSYKFSRAGIHRILAVSDRRCNTAECAVTVKGRPPVPSGLGYPAHVCPNSVILLTNTPSSAEYYTLWRSAWGGTYPEQAEGDSVSIAFGDTLATLLAFQVDREFGCRSDSIVLPISIFTLAPIQVDTVKICPGQKKLIAVADQSNDGVLYGWWMEYPELATITESNTRPYIDILANYTSMPIPYRAKLFLRRKSCRGDSVKVIILKIGETTPPSIHGRSTPCQYSTETYWMDYEHEQEAKPSACVWNGGGTTAGLSHEALFSTAGEQTISLHYVPKYECQTRDVQIVVNVFPVYDAYLDTSSVPGMVCMDFHDNINGSVAYQWTNGATSQCVPYTSGVEYECSAYIDGNPCPSTAAINIPSTNHPCDTSITIEESALTSTVTCFNNVRFQRNSNIPASAYKLKVTYALNNRTQEFDFHGPVETFSLDTVGPYAATISWRSGDTCYRAMTQGTVNILPRIDVRYNCADSLIITDKSGYYDLPVLPFVRTLEVRSSNNVLLGQWEMYIINTRHAIPTTGISDGEELSVIYKSGACEYVKHYTFHAAPHNVTITARKNMCNQAPFLFSGNAEGTGLTYRWSFPDGSYNFGKNMWHVFGNESNNRSGLVHLQVTDSQGCHSSTDSAIFTKNNPFVTYRTTETGQVAPTSNVEYKIVIDNNNYPVCSGTPIKLVFNTGYYPHSPRDSTMYVWFPQNDTTYGDSNYATFTSTYFVYATDTLYQCKGADRKDLLFTSTPKAAIRHKQYYCQGNSVTLIGNTGTQYLYEWTITSPTNVESSYNTANVSFDANETGVWKAKLKVALPQEMGDCSSIDSTTFNVTPLPEAPSLEFAGNECITDGSVPLQSSDGNSLVWSNGTYGTITNYYYDGPVSAFYIDPLTGCKSPSTQMLIPMAPRFDALLTGCFYVCEEQDVYVDLYSLGTPVNWWHWIQGNTIVEQGQTLPHTLSGTDGEPYHLAVSFGNECETTSPELTLNGINCEDNPYWLIDLHFDKNDLKLDGCKITGHFSFYFENRSEHNYVFNNLAIYPDQPNWLATPATMAVPAHSTSGTVELDVVFSDLSQVVVVFSLLDGSKLLGDFSVNLVDWLESQNLHNGCYFGTNLDIVLNHTLGELGQTVFFDYEIQPLTSDVMFVWSDECEVIGNSYDPSLNILLGLLFFDYGKLSQLSYADSCVHLHLLVCQNDELCIADTCIEADRLMEGVPAQGLGLRSKKTENPASLPPGQHHTLKPNPATGIVTVFDLKTSQKASDINRIEVFSSNGQKVLTVNNSSSFDIRTLAKAAYIVRITTKDGKTEYVKLIKL